MTADTFNVDDSNNDADLVLNEDLVSNVSEDTEAANVEDVKEEVVVKSPEPVAEAPGLLPVANGVIGTGTVKKEASVKPKKEPATAKKTVALFASRNVSWNGIGKLVKGYNIVNAEDADKWLTLNSVRLVTPEEVKTNLG